MHRSEGRERPLGEGGDVLRPGDVRRHGEHLGTTRLQRLRHGVERPCLHVGEHELHALVREPLGQRPPDPTRRPRNDGDASLEILH
jgi:hypothetical protein